MIERRHDHLYFNECSLRSHGTLTTLRVNFSREVRRPCSVSGWRVKGKIEKRGKEFNIAAFKANIFARVSTNVFTELVKTILIMQENHVSCCAAFSVVIYTVLLLPFHIPAGRKCFEFPFIICWNQPIQTSGFCILPMPCAIIQFILNMHTELDPRDGDAYFLPCHQQVLVHVGAQEARVAVTLHQLVDVVLNGKSVGKREREDTWV